MKKLFYLIAVAGLVITSCAKTNNEIKPEPEPKEEGRTFSFSIGAEKAGDGTDDTRIEMIDGSQYWSVSDKVGLFTTVGYPNTIAIAENIPMSGIHTQPTRSGTFVGELTESHIEQVKTWGMLGENHLSYYPYSESLEWELDKKYGGFYLTHSLPREMTLTKNVFPSEHVFMIATPIHGEQLVTAVYDDWGNVTGVETHQPTFHYVHLLSYMRLKLDANLMGQNVTKIEMHSHEHPSGHSPISGNVWIDPYAMNIKKTNTPYEPEMDYRTINIPEGFNVGDEIYIPMYPGSYSYIMFTFVFENGARCEKHVQSITLNYHTIHNIKFKLPFIADFSDYYGTNNNPFLPDGLFSNSFDFIGHQYLSNGVDITWAEDGISEIRTPSGLRVFDIPWDYSVGKKAIIFGKAFGTISDDDGGGEYTLATPPLDLSGKTSVPVQVSVVAGLGLHTNSYDGYGGNHSYNCFVNTVPTDATSYIYDYNMYNGAAIPFTQAVENYYSTPVPSTLTLTPENSRIGISFKGSDAYIHPHYGYNHMVLYTLEVLPL